MRALLCVLATFLLTSATPVKRDVSCESVLSVKVCSSLKKAASSLKLKSDVIGDAIKEAYAKGLSTSQEIQSAVEKFLEEKIKNKSCEDFFDKKYCNKLTSIQKYIRDKSGKLFQKALVKSVVLTDKLFQLQLEVENYFKNELLTKNCEDLLPKDKCEQIEAVGKRLRLKADEIKQAIAAGVTKGVDKVESKVKEVFEEMKTYAQKFSCEELFNPDVCKDMRSYATKLKVSMPKMINAAVTAVTLGYKTGKGFVNVVYKIADAFYDCEDFISKENCAKVKELASKVGANMLKVKEALEKAISKGMTTTDKIYKSTVDYLKGIFGKKRSVQSTGLLHNKQWVERTLLELAKDEYAKYFSLLKLQVQQLVKYVVQHGRLTDAQVKQFAQLNSYTKNTPLYNNNNSPSYFFNIRQYIISSLTFVSTKTRDILLGFLQKPTAWLLSNARSIVKLIGENTNYANYYAVSTAIEKELETQLFVIYKSIASDIADAIETASKQKRTLDSGMTSSVLKALTQEIELY